MEITRSTAGYAETTARLVRAIEGRRLAVFARLDHAAGAREAGLELEPEEVVVFGDPRAGTPLMQRDRRVGIELPLRMLVWQDGDEVMLGYRDPRELADVYDLGPERETLDRMFGLLGALAADAAGTAA
jgi:uncharacterized protein (DUF302 family)